MTEHKCCDKARRFLKYHEERNCWHMLFVRDWARYGSFEAEIGFCPWCGEQLLVLKKPKMTEDEAKEWARDMYHNGTYPARQAYREQFSIGEIAKERWDDSMFTYGIEYGILIAVAKIYGDLQE